MCLSHFFYIIFIFLFTKKDARTTSGPVVVNSPQTTVNSTSVSNGDNVAPKIVRDV